MCIRDRTVGADDAAMQNEEPSLADKNDFEVVVPDDDEPVAIPSIEVSVPSFMEEERRKERNVDFFVNRLFYNCFCSTSNVCTISRCFCNSQSNGYHCYTH